jgi:NADPH:quinone reductase-like Zn-dependent oxidoreductase
MKAAVVMGQGVIPVYGDFPEPIAGEGTEIITVSASALSQFSKSRSTGSHYASEGAFPLVAGADGVGRTADGRRVYFAMPESPFGALAEKCLVRPRLLVSLPEEMDDVTAAAIANPGMSAWAALVERAQLQPGETVLVNGATGAAGKLAIQLAKYLGAGRIIAAGRNPEALGRLLPLGADAVIPFALGSENPDGAEEYEKALRSEFAHGIDVVVDYLWGESARTVIVAIAKAVEDARPVRFIHVGGASREENVAIPGVALRSSAIQLMGSGAKSVPLGKLLEGIRRIFEIAGPSSFQVATVTAPLPAIEQAWSAPGNPRTVITIP